MLDFYLVADLVVVVALIGLAIMVLLKDKKAELNRIFAFFVVFISVWIIANYISNDIANSSRTAVVANYFVFSFSFGAAYYLLKFAIMLSGDKIWMRRIRSVGPLLFLIGMSSFTPLIVSGVKLQGNVYAVEFGALLPIYFVALLSLVFLAVHVLRKNIKHATGDKKGRLRVLFRSLIWTIPTLLLMNFIIPTTTGWFALTNIGVLSMLILVYGLYYGVIKHRLFDLRLIIVRALGYLLSLGTVSGLYVLVSFYVTSLIRSQHNEMLSNTLHILLIALVIVAYSPAKRAFNKLSNRFFYRDAYDPQELFDQLNRTLVSSLNLQYLLHHSSEIIAESIKAEHVLFVLSDKNLNGYRVIGTSDPSYTQEDIALLRKSSLITHQSMLVTDALDEKNAELRQLLNKNNIAVLVRLAPDTNKDEVRLGYLVLGPKKSGNPYSRQDIRVLDTVANELIIAIQNALHFEEIQQFNITLQAKVQDATQQLRRTNSKLEALDETKDDFISMASHQLRTPLTSVKGYLSMVLDGDAGKVNETQRKMLTQAFISSQRMVYLIADLLNVSRLKTGKFVIDSSPTDLSKLITEEVSQLVETAESREIKLTYTKPAKFPVLQFDETKIRQVIMNFIDNAIYYTPAGGHIDVQLIDKDSSIELRVVDDGIGVPSTEQHHLFTKFYRARNAQKARPDGTGLGLFMAKKVVMAQGGAILFDSKEDKGSTFGFVFSKAKLQSLAPVTSPITSKTPAIINK